MSGTIRMGGRVAWRSYAARTSNCSLKLPRILAEGGCCDQRALAGSHRRPRGTESVQAQFSSVDRDGPLGDSIFDELRVADSVNREEFDEAIPEGDGLKMITTNPAEALAVGDRIGRIAVGFKADLWVLQRRDEDPNRSLLKNEVQDVQWVRGGDGCI